jgi:O-antigen ligase
MSAYLKISRFFLFLIPLTVFLVTPQTLFPFIVGKYSFFRLMVDASLIFLMLAWGKGNIEIDWRSFKRPLALGVIIWVAVFLLATIFAYDPWAAFWGNFERGESGVQLLHLLIFFFLLTVLLKNKSDWESFLKMNVLGGFLVIVYGLLAGQVAGFVGPAFSLHTRFQGSLGNPDYIGQYMLFLVFFALYLLLERSSFSKKASLIYGFWAILFFVTFIFSQTRGAFLGFTAAALVFLIYLIFNAPKKKQRIIFTLLFLFIVIGIGAFISFRHSPFVKNLPVVGRFAEISLDSARGRILTWQSALLAIKDRPLLGWGPENFSVAFDKYFNPGHFDPEGGGETWFDRAHSVILDYGTETGLLGLAAYLGMFVLYYIQFFQSNKIKKQQITSHPKQNQSLGVNYKLLIMHSLFFAMPIGYLVTGATLFDVLPMYLVLFTFLALTNKIYSVHYN